LPNGKALELTRLQNSQVVETADKRRFTVNNLNYYWFIGYKDMTASHLSRTEIDLRDRMLGGFSQRWAYVTVAATVTEGLAENGRSEKQTADIVEQFIKELAPRLQKPDGSPLL
jgi:hypothetical protein